MMRLVPGRGIGRHCGALLQREGPYGLQRKTLLQCDGAWMRLKTGGGHNGHNGLRNIIDCFGGNKNFHRLRIGIGHPGHKSKVHNYVLSKASPDEQISTATSIQATLNFIPDIVKGDFQKVMRELHQKNFGAPNE